MNLRPEFIPELQTYLHMNDAFLSCLVVMHYYWYFLMCKVTWRVMTRAKVLDIHNDVTKKLRDEKVKPDVASKQREERVKD